MWVGVAVNWTIIFETLGKLTITNIQTPNGRRPKGPPPRLHLDISKAHLLGCTWTSSSLFLLLPLTPYFHLWPVCWLDFIRAGCPPGRLRLRRCGRESSIYGIVQARAPSWGRFALVIFFLIIIMVGYLFAMRACMPEVDSSQSCTPILKISSQKALQMAH